MFRMMYEFVPYVAICNVPGVDLVYSALLAVDGSLRGNSGVSNSTVVCLVISCVLLSVVSDADTEYCVDSTVENLVGFISVAVADSILVISVDFIVEFSVNFIVEISVDSIVTNCVDSTVEILVNSIVEISVDSDIIDFIDSFVDIKVDNSNVEISGVIAVVTAIVVAVSMVLVTPVVIPAVIPAVKVVDSVDKMFNTYRIDHMI